MQVEVYDEREIQSDTLSREPDGEALALIEELGLTKQKSEDGQRITYPCPTADQSMVLRVLFPTATKLTDYDAGGLPLRVLKEIRSYRAENPSHLLIVRHSPPTTVIDPVLVAWTGEDHEYYWNGARAEPRKLRLVARWGDALESWDALLKKAMARASEQFDRALAGIIGQAQAVRARIAAGEPVQTHEMPSLSMPSRSFGNGSDPF